MSIQQYIDRARAKKATTLSMRLVREGATEDSVRAMACSDWMALCGRCGIKNMPSAETMSLVLLEVKEATSVPEPPPIDWRTISADW